MRVDEILDVKGLNCPLPILRTKAALLRIQPGEVLEILATDPHAVIDFQGFCAQTGHELLHVSETDGVFKFLIRKSEHPC
ncbi:MAG: sulfurtransferase TusA family protein [Gammaproteobacteria bacterium]|nr:sulfurtransferase TusA family protein [Gammaproteobacteria bacterium]MCI0591261.1 sulfurtransferase TusA family protein [Gammaproteobacteria bacterium]